MEFLSAVSETALITLKAHVVESETANLVSEDAVAIECLNRLRSMLPVEIRDRVLNRKVHSTATVEALQQIAPRYVVPCHCTGWLATYQIARAMPEAFIPNSVGTTFIL